MTIETRYPPAMLEKGRRYIATEPSADRDALWDDIQRDLITLIILPSLAGLSRDAMIAQGCDAGRTATLEFMSACAENMGESPED